MDFKARWFTFDSFVSMNTACLFDTVDVIGAVEMCALGRTAAQVTLFYLFVVMNENVSDQNVG